MAYPEVLRELARRRRSCSDGEWPNRPHDTTDSTFCHSVRLFLRVQVARDRFSVPQSGLLCISDRPSEMQNNLQRTRDRLAWHPNHPSEWRLLPQQFRRLDQNHRLAREFSIRNGGDSPLILQDLAALWLEPALFEARGRPTQIRPNLCQSKGGAEGWHELPLNQVTPLALPCMWHTSKSLGGILHYIGDNNSFLVALDRKSDGIAATEA
jgi:hypothetical protein